MEVIKFELYQSIGYINYLLQDIKIIEEEIKELYDIKEKKISQINDSNIKDNTMKTEDINFPVILKNIKVEEKHSTNTEDNNKLVLEEKKLSYMETIKKNLEQAVEAEKSNLKEIPSDQYLNDITEKIFKQLNFELNEDHNEKKESKDDNFSVVKKIKQKNKKEIEVVKNEKNEIDPKQKDNVSVKSEGEISNNKQEYKKLSFENKIKKMCTTCLLGKCNQSNDAFLHGDIIHEDKIICPYYYNFASCDKCDTNIYSHDIKMTCWFIEDKCTREGCYLNHLTESPAKMLCQSSKFVPRIDCKYQDKCKNKKCTFKHD